MKGLTRKRIIIIAGAAVAVIALTLVIVYITSLKKESGAAQYDFAEITRGDLENTVTATGALSAVGTVEVGTQVSGTLARILVDFNSKVHKGDLLAVLDTTMLRATVKDVQAGLMSAKAQYEQAKAEYDRNLPLAQKGYLSDEEFLPIRIGVQTREAAVKSAEAALDRATANLGYAVIRSPIDGTIIQRNIELGQTVAASLSAPTLFVVAENLSAMQILASVDENDISRIKDGQAVRFTVQAYPDDTFTGTVSQIRLQPLTVQNVVNYTVVINAPNENGLLLPGMTATVDFVIEQREGVLLVPNAALRITPSKEMLAELARESNGAPAGADSAGSQWGRRGGTAGRGDSATKGGQGGSTVQSGSGWRGGSGLPADVKRIWYLDSDKHLRVSVVKTGISDGKLTELVSGQSIREGMKVISGLRGGTTASSTSGQSGPRPQGFRLF
jgi:HlyD family secretion protein